MIQRTRDENDRRQVYLTMTEHGKSVYHTSDKQMQEVISLICSISRITILSSLLRCLRSWHF